MLNTRFINVNVRCQLYPVMLFTTFYTLFFLQDLLFCPDFTVSANKKSGPVSNNSNFLCNTNPWDNSKGIRIVIYSSH